MFRRLLNKPTHVEYAIEVAHIGEGTWMWYVYRETFRPRGNPVEVLLSAGICVEGLTAAHQTARAVVAQWQEHDTLPTKDVWTERID